MSQPTVALIIPVYNAENDIPMLFPAIMRQNLQPDYILIIDSSSKDKTKELLAAYPVKVHTISQRDFDHGGTRKLGTQLVDADIYIYLTQDAYPANADAFGELVKTLQSDDNIGCAYGRQLPKGNATPLSEHLRLFNYPETAHIRNYADRDQYGIKTCFNSDSFSAYKRSHLNEAGNFPNYLMTGEDAFVAAKMLKNGRSIGYAANAKVFHSHNLSIREEFHRYFSIGVFHGRENWILHEYHSATGEGIRFVKSEMSFLIKRGHYLWIPLALISSMTKYMAYQLGLNEKNIPYFFKRKIGINKSFWQNDHKKKANQR